MGIGAFPEAVVQGFEGDALVLELAFGGFKGLGLFLSDADKDNAIADGVLAAHAAGDLVSLPTRLKQRMASVPFRAAEH